MTWVSSVSSARSYVTLVRRFSCPVTIVVDPAGTQRAQTDERSAVDIIKAEGFKVFPAKTNSVSARLSAVDDFLMRQVDGDAAFLVDPRCSHLKSAMMGGYRFHPKNGNVEKNKHSHIAEALQYLMLHIHSVGEGALTPQAREVKRVAAWGGTYISLLLGWRYSTVANYLLSPVKIFSFLLDGGFF